MPTRRQYKGAAAAATLNSSIDSSQTSFALSTTPSGWPDADFFIVVDRALSTQEVMFVASRSGATLNGISRGQADTVGVAHDPVANKVEHVGTKVDLDEANAHTSDSESDPHSTKLLNNTRHDTTARHTLGTVVPASTTAADLGTPSGGDANSASRGNHVHGFPASTPYTPTWTAFLGGTNPVLGNGTLTGKFIRAGKWGFIRIELGIGSTTNLGSGAWQFSLPSGWSADGHITAMSSGSVGTLSGIAVCSGTAVTSVLLPDNDPVATSMLQAQSTHPAAWTNGDSLKMWGWVELT